MAPKNRISLEARSERGQRLIKGIPSLNDMAPFFVSEEAAVQYLISENVLHIPVYPTCQRECLRQSGAWRYRCQLHKHSQSLVSLKDLYYSTNHFQLTSSVLARIARWVFFFEMQVWSAPGVAYSLPLCNRRQFHTSQAKDGFEWTDRDRLVKILQAASDASRDGK